MRKVAFVLLAILLIVPAATAQETVSLAPRFSFVYSVTGHEVRVATLLDNLEWVQTTIPARVLFGRVDVGLVQPQWTADGRTLYVTIYEPETESLAVTIGAFDVASRQFRRVTQVVDPAQTGYEFVRIESLSPDGRFAWVSRMISLDSYLIDLQSGKTVTQSACPARVLEWLEHEVMLACTGALFAQPNLFTLDLSSGQPGRLLQPPLLDNRDMFAAYVTGGMRLANDRVLVGAFNSTQPTDIGVVAWSEYASNYVARGTHLSVSSDQRYAAFFKDNRLMRLDVQSGTVRDMGAADLSGSPMWNGNTLQFWQTRERNGNFEIVRVEAGELTRREQIIYSGERPLEWSVSPNAPMVAVGFRAADNHSYVELHDAEGVLWVSDFAYPGSYVQLQPEYRIAWTQDGNWLHLRHAHSPAEMPRTLSVNVQNRQTILAPELRAIFVGESDDRDWWMYEVSENGLDTPVNRLLVVRPFLNDIRLINEAVPLYNDFQYASWNYYVWSPPVQ